jgi:HlyD family secretion protein
MKENLREFPLVADRQGTPVPGNRPAETGAADSLHRYLFFGFATAAALVVGVGGWLMFASISSAVIAPGSVVVESSSKVVQHAEGGIVEEIAVRDGDRVKTGSLLVRLDGTAIKANLAIVVSRMNEMAVRDIRLAAERDQKDSLMFPAPLRDRLAVEGGLDMLEGEAKLFEARRETLLGQRKQLRERVTQIRDEITGLVSQAKAIAQELELTIQELDLLRDLKKQRLVSLDRYMPLERGAARLRGGHGQMISDIARARGRIGETELQILQLDKEFRESVLSELSTVRVSLAELTEQRIAAEDQLRRLDIRAPQSGVVHQLVLHTRGGVISPGQPLMHIVPQDEGHVVEANVAPGDIDQIELGQDAVVHFSAFNQRTTPQLGAMLYSISADLAQDERTGAQYYIARLRLNAGELERLDGLSLTPGMPADVFIQTGSRSAMSYLTKPFVDQLNRAFREE